MTALLALFVLACAPPPPTQVEAEAWVEALQPTLDRVEAAVATEVDARFPAFVCRGVVGSWDQLRCIEQKSAWERARLASIAQLQPAIASQLGGEVIGVGVLVAGVGTATAGDRPPPAVPGEEGPRQGPRWVGWGADRGGPFVETVRKMSIGESDVAIRIVARPPAGP